MFEFRIKLSDYEGPLDLLLVMIKKKKIDIADMNIIEISDQFVSLVNNSINDIPVNEFSEYLYMTSYLIFLKTKSLLPNYEFNYNSINIEEDREELIRRLIEYDKYKNSISFFEDSLNKRQKLFDKLPEDYNDFQLTKKDDELLNKKLSVEKLRELFEKIIQELIINQILENNKLFRESVEFNAISIKEVQMQIINTLNSMENKDRINIIKLFEICCANNINKVYFCVFFLSLLVLIKNQYIQIEIENNQIFIINFKNINIEEMILEEGN